MDDFEKSVEQWATAPTARSFEKSNDQWKPSSVVKRKDLNSLKKVITLGIGLLVIFGICGSCTYPQEKVAIQKSQKVEASDPLFPTERLKYTAIQASYSDAVARRDYYNACVFAQAAYVIAYKKELKEYVKWRGIRNQVCHLE
jgi:hypothetical protein